MPTVHRFAAYRVVIYPHDHRPAHVHVIGGDGEAIFNLNCPAGPPTLRESVGFKPGELAKIKAELTEHVAALCAAWSRIHGYS